MLSLGDGVVVGVPLVLASAYFLVASETKPARKRLTAAVTALGR
jgi:hypothetical protein